MVSSDSTEKKDILTIQEILAADNVAELLTDDKLTDITKQVTEDYNRDQSSCSNRMNKLKDIVALAKMISEEKTYPWDGASNVIYPLIANASIEFGATLYPEIIKDNTVVKAKIIGKDDGKPAKDANGIMIDPETKQPIMANAGAKKKRGDRVATYMNYELFEEMDWWESDMDKIGNASPILGNLYKKVYRDPIRDQNVSELIFPDKIVINNAARDIKSTIITHLLELYPSEIMERIRSGIYLDFDYDYESNKNNQSDPQDIDNVINLEDGKNYADNTKIHIFLEQHTWLDLDDDGFPEPYVITTHTGTNNKTIRIIPRFRKQDIKKNSKGQISKIKAKQYFVKYGFIPSPDGSFFDIGFGDLLFNLNQSVNSTINQLFDAGHLSITGGGFIAKGIKTKGGRFALSPGEWITSDTIGIDLKNNIVPLPHPTPDPTLFALLGYLVEAGKGMSMLKNVLTGESASNIQATTQISMVEQGLKQFKAIYKRIYKSLKEELKLLYELDAEYLVNEKYAQVLDEPLIDVDVKMDFNSRNYDICPVADIDAVTSYQRMAMAQFLMQFVNNPYVNQIDLIKRIMDIAKVDDVDKLVVAPVPQVNPLMEIEQLKAQVKMKELELEAQKMQQENAIAIQLAIAEIQKERAEIEKIRTASMVDLANVSKIGADINDAQSEREVKIMDNLIDQQTKRMEVAGRLEQDRLKLAGEAMKINHQSAMMKHEKELKEAESNINQPE